MKLEGLILLEDAGMKCRLLLLRLGGYPRESRGSSCESSEFLSENRGSLPVKAFFTALFFPHSTHPCRGFHGLVFLLHLRNCIVFY